jgi:hypothetical protein
MITYLKKSLSLSLQDGTTIVNEIYYQFLNGSDPRFLKEVGDLVLITHLGV